MKRAAWVVLLAALSLPAAAQDRVALGTGPRVFAAEDVLSGGDRDQNDVVVRYARRCIVEASTGELVSEVLHVAGLSAGARRTNRLHLRLPATPEDVRIARGPLPLEPASVLPDDSVALFDDFRQAFVGAPGGFVNTEVDAPVVAGIPVRVEVTYAAGSRPFVGAAGPCPEPDLRVVSDANGGVPIDRTTSVGPLNLPLVGTFPGAWSVPREQVAIEQAYPSLLCHLLGQGCDTWYTSSVSDLVIARVEGTGGDPDVSAPLPEFETCDDGILNQDEAEIDCGGALCPSCGGGGGAPSAGILDPPLRIGAGFESTVGVRASDDAAVYWGLSSDGEANVPAGEAFFTVALASNHICALRVSDGQPRCWGRDGDGQVSGTPVTASFDRITVGRSHSCGLNSEDGSVECWGAADYATVPAGVAFDAIDAGPFVTCGIRRDDGTLTCWGLDFLQQISGVPSGVAFDAVAVGSVFACGIRRSDGGISCWGNNNNNQVSNAPATGAYDAVFASNEGWHACAIRRDDGEIVCWGNNSSLQSSGAPVGVAFDEAALGSSHTCAIRRDDRQMVCWGGNNRGQSSPPSGVAF